MSDIQAKINLLLEKLKISLDKIGELRTLANDLENDLTEVQHDYELKLGSLNIEATQLERLIIILRASLARKPVSVRESEQISPPPVPPPELIEDDSSEPKPLPPPEKDPRASRKRALADHVMSFVPNDEMETVLQVVNAILDDEQRDVGDMLELIPWGVIWTARAEAWETPEMQFDRLQGWNQELQARLTYWEGQIQRLKKDERDGLLQEMRVRSHSDWLAYLEGLASKQAEQNKEMRQEIVFLQQQIAKRTINEG